MLLISLNDFYEIVYKDIIIQIYIWKPQFLKHFSMVQYVFWERSKNLLIHTCLDIFELNTH